MIWRAEQRAFIERYSTPLGTFAETAHEECGRGAIFIRWPGEDSEDWICVSEVELFRRLQQLGGTPEEVAGDDLLRALREYDSSWRAIIIFLNDLERRVDVHQVGFLKETVDPLFAYPMRSAAKH